jgi:kynurenine 3-monooxygenase
VSALLFAQAGYDVHVFEGRADPRRSPPVRGRSIALTLTHRGWTAIRSAGLEAEIRQIALPLRGRRIHAESGEQRYQPYGTSGEAIDCVSRPALTALLLERVSKEARVHLHFGWRCVDAFPEESALVFQTEHGTVRVGAARILAADGASSPVRRSLLRREDFDLSQTYSKLFYKELNIPLLSDGGWPLDPEAIHIWPRGDSMLAAFPSTGQGFMGTLFMPMDGARSFNALSRPRDVERFFRSTFPDLEPHLPRLVADFYAQGPSHLVSVRCFPWVFRGLALIGDAAHAMVPFLGQGLNAGLEDISVLVDCVTDGESDWQAALYRYQQRRKLNCDAVSDIAAQHFNELAEAARDPRFLWKKKLEVRLGQLFPKELESPYHIVSFSDRPYLEACRSAALQRRVLDRLLVRPELEQGYGSEGFERELISLARSVLDSEGMRFETL